MFRLMMNEAACTLRCGLHPLEVTRPLVSRTANTSQPEVLIVHGFMGHPRMFWPLARKLLDQGVPVVHLARYSSASVSVDDIIDHLEEIVQKNNLKECNLIGHSLGAVAIRTWLKERDSSPNYRRFIALGAPFNGTEWYRLVPQQLRPIFNPKSPRLAALNATEEPPNMHIIRARHDQNVRPSNSASIEGVPEIILEHIGHNGLINHPSAMNAVWNALGEASSV